MQKRNFPRLRIKTEAKVKTANGIVSCITENICLGGIFVKTSNCLRVGDKAEINLPIPLSSRNNGISVNGIVIRIEEDGIAFKFQNVGHETFCDLLTFIDYPVACCQAI